MNDRPSPMLVKFYKISDVMEKLFDEIEKLDEECSEYVKGETLGWENPPGGRRYIIYLLKDGSETKRFYWED